MAESKNTALTAATLREKKSAERIKLLAEKRVELQDAQRSLAARELANPRKISALKREIALILTVENERQAEATEEKA